MKKQELLTNMYCEHRIFKFGKKQYHRGFHCSIHEKDQNFVTGFITKWGEITAHIVFDKKSDVIYLYSFKKNSMIEYNKLTRTLFKHIRKTIENYEEFRAEEELKIAI